ncbi:hypothetical protein TIFTF001_027610 [Ficus carica]|uniref:Uncharacterized protein n=1 Tax=Ficus carica TaxID=3494 RepID=A0AA88DNH7_FICCA|nr:hypothetical protein TIFTF001_027610 [Ficus carica]
MIPMACAIIHNFIRIVWVGDPILEEYLTYIVPIGGHVDVNADVELPDGANDAGPSIGSQQDASTSGAMNQRREVLADKIWDRYQRFPSYKSN